MRRLLPVFVPALASMGALWAGPAAAAICPTTSNTNTDCCYILTINPGGTFTGAGVSGANPFDGNDDALIGVVNDSGAAFSTPIFLSGSSSTGGIFDFDGDGICTFVTCNYSDTKTY